MSSTQAVQEARDNAKREYQKRTEIELLTPSGHISEEWLAQEAIFKVALNRMIELSSKLLP